MYKKKELQLSYFSICEGKKLDDKIVTYFALKAGSTVYWSFLSPDFFRRILTFIQILNVLSEDVHLHNM